MPPRCRGLQERHNKRFWVTAHKKITVKFVYVKTCNARCTLSLISQYVLHGNMNLTYGQINQNQKQRKIWRVQPPIKTPTLTGLVVMIAQLFVLFLVRVFYWQSIRTQKCIRSVHYVIVDVTRLVNIRQNILLVFLRELWEQRNKILNSF